MMIKDLQLREAVNVAELKASDRLVRRVKRIRAEAERDLNTIEFWNKHHPDEVISADFERAVIAWCDGTGPFPATPNADGAK